MGVYLVPPVGAPVWVEFEHGDPDYPIWSGCRWGAGSDLPSDATSGNPADPNIVIQSLLQNKFLVSDMPPSPTTGGIILQSTTGAKIVVNDSGIYIDNGKGASITLVGPNVLCSHAGQAQPTVPNPRVTVTGQPTVTISSPYVIAGCTLPPPLVANGPCVTAQFVTAATRVTSNGQPLLLFDSQAICAPTGTLLIITVTQTRVTAT
jgi:hypothetical protein